jgi:hypothetical protein
MKTYDIFLSIVIILLFIGIYIFNTLTVGIDNIKKNWPKYRCNPTVMPFSSYFGHDQLSNFTYCIQNMQSSYMGHLLQPTHYVMSLFQNMLGQITTDINWVRKKVDSITNNIKNIFISIFSLFINIIIEFQRIFIKIKDTISKTVGILVTFIYLIEGGILSGKSVMAGPVGQTLRFVCFHPDTNVELMDGSFKKMKNINLGEQLKNGSIVQATLNINGNKNNNSTNSNTYYKIYSEQYKDFIYVTGSHLIKHPKNGEFINVCNYEKSIQCPQLKTETMSCLITDDHLIKLGEFTFWDWED